MIVDLPENSDHALYAGSLDASLGYSLGEHSLWVIVSESSAVLWWVNAQLADNFTLDDESATRFDDIRLIVDNALLQVEATTVRERHFMEAAASKSIIFRTTWSCSWRK